VGDVSEGDPAVAQIKLIGELRMSPQLAKRLALILIEQLKRYEQQFGEIPGPKE
jgi:hypothetical protein